VRVTKPPVVASTSTAPKVPLTKPITFSINKEDEFFTYSIATDTKSQSCVVIKTNIHCRIDKLGLSQGDEYTLTLMRSFEGKNIQPVAKQMVALLPPVTVLDSSVKEGQVLYANTSEVRIKLSAPVTTARAILEEAKGSGFTEIDQTTSVKDDVVTIRASQVLPREKNYRLTLVNVQTREGAELKTPYIANFQTSGGPKVIGVNIGASNVDANAQIIVTFDQPLMPGVDIKKFASLEGGEASISSQANTLIFALRGLTRCSAFTLHINKGIVGENSLPMKEDWSYISRISCRDTATIGYSVNGRPIVAYYYGSGATSILFTGGIHGTEASGSYIMQDWANYLDANAFKIPAGKQVVVVPSLNPDGLATNNRYNARGVNLDRNFPTANWSTDISVSGGGTKAGGGGSSPLSEPEAKAIADLTTRLRPRLEVSYHSQGSLVGANACSSSPPVARQYAAAVGYGTMIGTAEEVMGYTFTGEYEEWMCEKYGTTSILIELPTHTGRYFSKHLDALWQMVNY
jgi:hypothetical protein